MTSTESLTIEILKQIRDEIRRTNDRLDQTNARLDLTNERLDETNSRLGVVEETVLELATQQRFLVRNAKRTAAREKRFIEELEDVKGRLTMVEERVFPKS